MSKRRINIIVLICCCAVDNNVFGWNLYDFWQNSIGFLIDHIVPDIGDPHDHGVEIVTQDNNNNIENTNLIDSDGGSYNGNIINNAVDTQNNTGTSINSAWQLNDKINIEEFNKEFQDVVTGDKKWVMLIEMHYVWCAFYGTALNMCNEINKIDNQEAIFLDSKIIDFFKEPRLIYLSTLDVLKAVFAGNDPPYNDNFINQETTFKNFISLKLQDIVKRDGGVVYAMLEALQNIDIDEGKKALWWIFSVALGLYYQKEFSRLVSVKLNNGFFEGDRYKKNSAVYIVKSFQERILLFQKFISYFKWLYRICDERVNEMFIRDVVCHMYSVLKGKVHLDNFRNLLYRNKDKHGGYIDLVGNII